MRPLTAITTEGRVCTKCGLFKNWTDYHSGKSSNGKSAQCAVCVKARTDSWYANNKRRVDARRIKRKTEINAWRRLDYAKCPQKYKAHTRAWSIRNPEAAVSHKQRRRARVAGNGGRFTVAQWKTLKAMYGHCCVKCGTTNGTIHADHVIPVSKGGHSNISNIQPLCGSCNSSKRDTHADYRCLYKIVQADVNGENRAS
jgi:5-methylcytosine-specific restriction endonuclease McrA